MSSTLPPVVADLADEVPVVADLAPAEAEPVAIPVATPLQTADAVPEAE